MAQWPDRGNEERPAHRGPSVGNGGVIAQTPQRRRFEVDRSASAVLVEARSNVGAVGFGSTEIHGTVELARAGEGIDIDNSPSARLTVLLATLTSGNALYDAELQQRLAAQRYPIVNLELVSAVSAPGSGYQVSGTITLHGVTATLIGGVQLSYPESDTVLVTGEQVLDIRDFDIELPSVLMLRIYPDVKVSLHLLAREVLLSEGGL